MHKGTWGFYVVHQAMLTSMDESEPFHCNIGGITKERENRY